MLFISTGNYECVAKKEAKPPASWIRIGQCIACQRGFYALLNGDVIVHNQVKAYGEHVFPYMGCEHLSSDPPKPEDPGIIKSAIRTIIDSVRALTAEGRRATASEALGPTSLSPSP